MGACTSRPKDLDHPQAQLPREKPSDDLHEPLVTKPDEALAETTIDAQLSARGKPSNNLHEPLVTKSDEALAETTTAQLPAREKPSNNLHEPLVITKADEALAETTTAQLPAGEKPSDNLHEPLVTKPDEALAETTTAQLHAGETPSDNLHEPLVTKADEALAETTTAQLPEEKTSDDLHEPLITKEDEAVETTTARENNNVNDGTSERQKVEKPLVVSLFEPTEPTTKTDGGVSDESSNPVADLVAGVDAESNKSNDGAQLSHNVDHQTTVTSDKKENHIDNVVVVAASETKKEVDEKQDGKTKEAAIEKSESTGEAEKSST